jgi:pyruvate kinase
MKKTKIVATLGPSTDDPLVIRKMLESGLDVARINFSHGTYDDHIRRIEGLREACEQTGAIVALLGDTKGPEIRTGAFANGKARLIPNSFFVLTTDSIVGDAAMMSISYDGLPNEVKAGDSILLDDGLLRLEVISVSEKEIVTKVKNGGYISNNKGVNVPGVSLNLPFLNEKDCADIKFMLENDFDILAASFVRKAEDVMEIKNELTRLAAKRKIRIIAKIENPEGVTNADSILDVADGLMVARGDLGVEMPFEELPIIQKELIYKAQYRGKEVITATQMLESMIHNPRPTRAETSDVANAIYDGTGAIMLSGETTIGKYPYQAVEAMKKIAERIESSIDYKYNFKKETRIAESSIPNAISHAAVTAAHELNAAAILAVTLGGTTARNIAKFRPDCPIIACTPDPAAARSLKLDWGVNPLLINEGANETSTLTLFTDAVKTALEAGMIKKGDIVVMTAGIPVGTRGSTNMIKIHEVGKDILIF